MPRMENVWLQRRMEHWSGTLILFNKDVNFRGWPACGVFGGRSLMGANLQMGDQAISKPTRGQCLRAFGQEGCPALQQVSFGINELIL